MPRMDSGCGWFQTTCVLHLHCVLVFDWSVVREKVFFGTPSRTTERFEEIRCRLVVRVDVEYVRVDVLAFVSSFSVCGIDFETGNELGSYGVSVMGLRHVHVGSDASFLSSFGSMM